MEAVPGQTFAKDPKVVNKNTGTAGDGADAWAFMKVVIPTANVQLVDEDAGTPLPAAETELFSFVKSSEHWVAMGDPIDAEGSVVYWFAYDQTIAPDEETEALFNEVTYANVLEGQMTGAEDVQIDVTGYGIQAQGFDTYADAWTAFATQNGMTEDADAPTI